MPRALVLADSAGFGARENDAACSISDLRGGGRMNDLRTRCEEERGAVGQGDEIALRW
jgi:hypothetical protein